MALSTSTTFAPVIASEVIREAMNPLTPKSVYLPFCTTDNIDGESAAHSEYPVKSDLGAAGTATEGVDISSTTTLSYGSSVEVTPTEAAVMRSDITLKAARKKLPGESMQAFASRIMAGDFTGLLGLLEEEAMRHNAPLAQKAETDVVAQLDDFTDSVGSTGVDISIPNMIDAITALERNEPEHENFVWFLDPEVTRIIRNLLATGTGVGIAGAFAGGGADNALFNFAADVSRNGDKGTWLGIPVRQLSAEVNPLPNVGADVASALVAVGGSPYSPGGQLGATIFVEGHAPVVLLDVDPSGRAIELISIWEYGVAELRDEHGVTLLCDAP